MKRLISAVALTVAFFMICSILPLSALAAVSHRNPVYGQSLQEGSFYEEGELPENDEDLMTAGTQEEKEDLPEEDGEEDSEENDAPPALLAAPPQKAAGDTKTVEVKYKLVNAMAYNYAWRAAREAGIQIPDSFEITLLEDGQPIDREGVEAVQTISRNTNNDTREQSWTLTWELPTADENGEAITYGELNVSSSPSLADGTLSGRYVQSIGKPISYNSGQRISISITTTLYGFDNLYMDRTWNGDGGDTDPYSIRPADIGYTVYANGEQIYASTVEAKSGRQTLYSVSNSTTGATKGGLPQLDEDGNPIHYTVSIDNVPEYYTYELTQFPFVEGTGHLKNGSPTLNGIYPSQLYSDVVFTLNSKSVSATFLFEGDGIGSEAELKNRPSSLNVQLEYSTDGGASWQKFWGKYAYDVTESGDVPNSLTYTWDSLPAVDSEGNPVEYRVVQEDLFLYATSYDEPVDSADGTHRDITVHDSYRDNWNYKLDLRWRETDPARKYDINEVSVSRDVTLKAVYELNVSVQKHYEPGDMQIRIPYTILTPRVNGTYVPYVTPSAFSLGPANNPSPDFAYTYVIEDNGTPNDKSDDMVLFYNYKALESNDNVIIAVQYNINPYNVIDCSETTLQAQATGVYTDATGERSEPEEQVSHSIHYRLDTGITGLNVTKTAKENIYYWNSSWGEEPDDFDMDAYNYVYYTLRVAITNGNQPLHFEVTDAPSDDGEIIRIIDTSLSTRPVVEPEITEDGYRWVSGTMTSKTSYRDYDIIVRYPRREYPDPLHDGESTYETDYSNTVTARAVAEDVHEGDKGPDDQNDILEGESAAYDHWVDYEFVYTGEIYSTRKGMGPTAAYVDPIKYNADMRSDISWLEMTVNGYNFSDGYRLDLSDDAVYARATIDGVTTSYVRLQPEDYYFSSPSTSSTTVTVYLTEVDRTNGKELLGTMPEEGLTVWGKKSFDGEWEQIPVTLTGVSEQNKYYSYTLSDINDGQYVQMKFSLPEGLKDKARLIVNNLGVTIKGTSPTIHRWIEQGEDVKIHLENFAAFELFVGDSEGNYTWANPYESTSNPLSQTVGLDALDLAEMGAYRHRKNDGWDLKTATITTTGRKITVSEYPDPTNQTYTILYRLSCVDEYNVRTLPDEVYEAFCHESGVFFDLLPEGFHLDETKQITVYGAHRIYTGSSYGTVESLTLSNGTSGQGRAVLVSVDTIDDYDGTGRQLVIFHVKSIMEPGKNYGKNHEHTFTGFAVDFYCIGAYDDIPEGKLYNFACYQRTDDDLIAQGVTDEKAAAKPGYYYPPVPVGNDGNDAFYDINGDGHTDIPDTSFMYSTVTPDFLRTIENGLSKKVRAHSDGFDVKDVADLGSEYTYRLKMTASSGGVTKGVIFYDVLENAANTEGHTGEIWWKGSFSRVDVSSAEEEGIDVKVWYSTKQGLSYNAPEMLMLDEAPEGTWTDVCPDDPSTVTAVAFDLRYNKDGTEKEFSENETVKVDIIMIAPDELQEAELAYNRPAYDSTFVPKNSPTEIESFNIGSRVEVSLRDLQEIEIRKIGPSFDDPDTTVPLGGAVFTLYKCSSTEEDHTHSVSVTASSSCWKKYMTLTTTADGKVTFTELDTGSYRLQETTGPSGYNAYGSSNWWIFEVNASTGTVSEPVAYKSSSSGTLVELVPVENAENAYTLMDSFQTINLQVRKQWSRKDTYGTNRPSSVTFNIYRSRGEGAEKELYDTVTLTVSGTGVNQKTIAVQKYYDNASPYIYTVEEVPVAGYTSAITSQTNSVTSSSYSFTFMNTQVTADVGVSKIWDNLDGSDTAPEGASVTFTLYRDGTKTDYSVTLDGTADETKPTTVGGWESEAWKAEFVNLAEYRYVQNPDTKEYEPVKIVYTVKEETGLTGYSAETDSASADGSITNVQEETSVTAQKQWKNAVGATAAPDGASVTFALLADGEETDYTVTLDSAEDSAPENTGGYEVEAWKAAFVHLPKYRYENGTAVEIVYSVKETGGYAGYETDKDTVSDTGTIINVQQETEVTAEKTWKNADGTTAAPDGASVTFALLADGAQTGLTVTLDGTEEDAPDTAGGYEKEAWKAMFVHLPKYRYENGDPVAIVYSVKETAAYPGYNTANDTADDGGVITNTQEETSVTAVKKWKNADSTDTAPQGAEVTFTLLSDGAETSYTVTLKGVVADAPLTSGGYEAEAWKAAFVHLPKYRIENGEAVEIVYSVKETTEYPGYKPDKDTAENGGTITNVQEETEASAAKMWLSADGTEDSPGGAQVVFTLLSDGKETPFTVTLKGIETGAPDTSGGYEAEAWKAAFVHLPKYRVENGEAVPIVYTVRESTGYAGYEAEEDTVGSGETIVNVQIETGICAYKSWKNADGTKTPPKGASVTFVLLADGEETDFSVELDGTADGDEGAPEFTGGYESGEWKAEFVHLPKYAVGEDGTAAEIVYTVMESVSYPGYFVDGKDTVSDNGTITNRQKTETPDTGLFTDHTLWIVLLLVGLEALVLLVIRKLSVAKAGR
ncbi:MAG: Cna B-type domain-containing protein [Eubacteriales bacterium]|nr:Cna B-type domain-containing protein [Eubacteriales bacterium]